MADCSSTFYALEWCASKHFSWTLVKKTIYPVDILSAPWKWNNRARKQKNKLKNCVWYRDWQYLWDACRLWLVPLIVQARCKLGLKWRCFYIAAYGKFQQQKMNGNLLFSHSSSYHPLRYIQHNLNLIFDIRTFINHMWTVCTKHTNQPVMNYRYIHKKKLLFVMCNLFFFVVLLFCVVYFLLFFGRE